MRINVAGWGTAVYKCWDGTAVQTLTRDARPVRSTAFVHNTTRTTEMAKGLSWCLVACALILAVFMFVDVSSATYRKPPFNGSIFGKRSNTADYDNAGKALSSLCEIASEACAAWFPAAENN